MVYIQTILSQAAQGLPDPQTDLHTDTFHPTVKAWLFLTDVEPDAMPFVYVPGSHRLTPERLEWERHMSIAASHRLASGQHPLVPAISPSGPGELRPPPPAPVSPPAHTLNRADSFSVH